MKRPFCLLFAIVLLQTSFAQQLGSFGRANHLVGKGIINDDLKISIILDLIPRIDYDRQIPLPLLNVYSYQSTFEMITTFEKEESLVLLVLTSVPCCGAYFMRGKGCRGENTFLSLHLISESTQISYKELVGSTCGNYNDPEILHTTLASDGYSLVTRRYTGSTDYTDTFIKIDFDHLDKGIQKKEYKK
ncbi:MAG: hypothetical protein LBV39_05080 [Bacteroidales bacterium]|jgi:hypothetical protein|nr:hypothetical protein [Bacteroidales bacterium]